MQRCKTFHWNGVSPETRPTGRCSRRIRPIAIERTRVSLNARQTLPITGQLQGLAMRVHHNERSGFIVTCFWMGIDNNGGFIRLPHHPPRQLTGHHRLHVKRSDGTNKTPCSSHGSRDPEWRTCRVQGNEAT